jgi:hypothetical protein
VPIRKRIGSSIRSESIAVTPERLTSEPVSSKCQSFRAARERHRIAKIRWAVPERSKRPNAHPFPHEFERRPFVSALR